MTDDDRTTILRRLPEGWTSRRVVGAVALAATVAILVLGAVLVGRGGGRSAYAGAGERIGDLYASADVASMMAAFAPGTVPPEQREATEGALAQILRPGVEVVDVAEPVDVVGVPVVRVTTADRLEWCVRPDGGVLPRCRVGEVAMSASTDAPIDVVLSRADLPLEGPTQLTLALESTVVEPVRLAGLELEPAAAADDAGAGSLDAQLVQAVNVVGQQASPVEPGNPTLAAGSTLYLTWLTDVDLSDRDLVLRWDDGAIELDLRQVRWFVR